MVINAKNMEQSHTELNKEPNTVKMRIGTTSRSVIENQNKICSILRPILFSMLGVHWPFSYDIPSNIFKMKINTNIDSYSEKDFRKLSLSIGKCFNFSKKDTFPHKYKYFIPSVTKRFNKKTSQGKVVMTNIKIQDADFTIITKSNQITSAQKKLWLDGEIKRIISPYTKIKYDIIGKAFMDSICGIIFSKCVEKELSPHFPLCYATCANIVNFKRPRNDFEENTMGSLCQTIWMEFLPLSAFQILKKAKSIALWWSAFFQIAAALAFAQKQYSFYHNDFHSENIRVRIVPEDTKLYYKLEDGKIFEVPTFGYVYVIIDFGRCVIKPWDNENPLASCVFSSGECKNFIFDNQSSDYVRFITSVEDVIKVVENEKHREKLYNFCKTLCMTDDNEDYLALLNNTKEFKFSHMLEVYPRIHCHKAIPKNIINMFYKIYKVDNIPKNVIPFTL